MIDSTVITQSFTEYSGCTIRRQLVRGTKHVRGKGWVTRQHVRWAAFAPDGKFIPDRSKGRVLATCKQAIDRYISKKG